MVTPRDTQASISTLLHVSRHAPSRRFLAGLGAAALLALASCGGSSQGSPGGGDVGGSGTGGSGAGNGGSGAGTGGEGGTPIEPGTRFETTAADWALPAGAPAGSGFFTFANTYWTTVDLDGDAKPDLVVTDGATEQNRAWKVYKNTGSGFATTATSWTLPAGAPAGSGFFTFANTYWTTVDLDGDAKPDLVVTDGATEQNRVWKVYKNTGSGFATTATSWTLPAGAPAGSGFFTFANTYWTTADLDGDAKPDLVVTDGATEQNRAWKVYKNTGSGFATTATSWTLPAGAPAGSGFFTFANTYWTTADLDGDAKPDLVVTDGATEQNRAWKVYKNTGSSFATTAAEWALPAGAPAGSGYFTFANTYWTTADLDGDAKPDLVVTDGATEQNRAWKIYKNTGSGFATASADWALPAGAPAGSGFFTFANTYWTTADLDGDGRADLVVTDGATEQNRVWKLFRNVP
ncbi:cell surface protein [Minicystis rosea]|nr:cell surface protein [Minicystis rosea]